jgi:two-component system NtrC family sensor kinase
MSTSMISIRHKVVIAFILVYLFMAAGILGSWYFMHQLEGKISYLEDVSKLEESVLEVRRFEKNFFLYGDTQSLKTAAYHLTRTEDLLDKNFAKIESLSSNRRATAFKQDLLDYGRLIAVCSDAGAASLCFPSSEQRSDYETRIRKIGSSISEFAKMAAQRKRDSIKQTMEATVRLQLLAFALVGAGLVAMGGFLFAKVMKPLNLLEESTYSIARGQFKPIEVVPPEREIREIFNAFNRMAVQLQTREEQLVQSKKLASLGTMLAGVAHEVNNPLSNISSSCEILLEELGESDLEWQKSILKKVLEQVDKARGIVLNLLEFSRNKEFYKESFNLKDLLEKTLGLLHGQIPAGVKIVKEIDDNLRIYADKQRMQQAFMNIISNAVQSIETEGQVTIRANKYRDGIVDVVIKDTGKGIKEENLSKIFDPFFTTKDVGQGTGLGLFITHDIIVRHNGTIKAKSALGTGTTFTIRLPAQENLDA